MSNGPAALAAPQAREQCRLSGYTPGRLSQHVGEKAGDVYVLLEHMGYNTLFPHICIAPYWVNVCDT